MAPEIGPWVTGRECLQGCWHLAIPAGDYGSGEARCVQGVLDRGGDLGGVSAAALYCRTVL